MKKEQTEVLRRFGDRVGYSDSDLRHFQDGDPRLRLMGRLAEDAGKYSIQAEVVSAKHCNTGYKTGDYSAAHYE